MADKRSKLTYTIEINDKGKIKVDGLTKSFVKAETAFKKLGDEIKSTTKDGLNPMIDKTGLAGATLVELGRTISDSNYGIRGMANNFSQLSTLMITLISTTGGLTKGVQALAKAFMGPLGLIIIFQVIIALIERFDMQSSKTEESLNGIATAGASAGSNLKILRDVMDDTNLSTEELERAVNKANSEYKDLNIQIGENGKVTEESRKQIDSKILSLERLAKATAIQKEIEEVFTKIVSNQIKEQENLRTAEVEGLAIINALRQTEAGNVMATLVEMTVGEKAIRDKRIAGIKENAKEERDALNQRLEDLKAMIVDEDLLDEIFKDPRGRGKGLPKRAKERLLEFDNELKNFFLDIDKDGVEGVLVKGIERVKNIYKPLFESAKEGLVPLIRLGEEYDETLKRSEESLRNGLNAIKEQARDVSKLFKASQQSLKFVGDTILSYHDARMEALKRERDYVLNSGQITGAAQKKAIEDLERREIKAQERKIKAERDLFTIKQSLLIAEEIMKFKFEVAARKRELADKVTAITAEGVTQIGKAQMSAGTFAAQGGPLGLAAFAVTIGGLIASILAARKKAQAALSQLGAPSTGGAGGGGGVEAPDFNVVGASPESQLAQTVAGQQAKPLRAFVVHKDIKTADALDRSNQEQSTVSG